MRCRNCTTELWGTPALCPVCGTPTRLRARPRIRTGAPPPPPAQPPVPRQPSGAFNAADLLDPGVLADLPGAEPPSRRNSASLFNPSVQDSDSELEESSWLNSPAPPELHSPTRSKPTPSTGELNATDLFDPDVLAGLSFSGASPAAQQKVPGIHNGPAAQPQGKLNAADLFDPDVLAGLSLPEGGEERHERRSSTPLREWAGPSSGAAWDDQAEQDQAAGFNFPADTPRAPQSPLAPPLFSLQSLATPPPVESPAFERPAPPRPYSASFPLAGEPVGSPVPPAAPTHITGLPPRGWSVVSDPLPPVTQWGRRAPQPPPYPSQELAEAPVRRGHKALWTIGGLTSLLLALAVLGAASLFGWVRWQQILALQPTPLQGSGPLPTVAPKAGYTIYPDQALGFSLQYPTAWTREPDQAKNDPGYRGDLFIAGPYAALEVGSSPRFSAWSPGQIDDAVLKGTFAQLPRVTNVQFSAPTSPTIHIAGLDWTAEDADITFDTGTVIHATSLALIHQGRGYVIFYFALQNQFTTYSHSYFEPMLLSFRFLDG